MGDRLSDEERIAALGVLDSIAKQLNQAAGKFEAAGAEAVASMVDRAATELAAACWVLSEPLSKPAMDVSEA